MVRDDYYGTLDELRARRWTFWDADRRETSEKRIRRPPATRSLPRSLLPPYRAAYPAGCSETSASLSLPPPLLKPAPPRRAISFISTPVRLFVSRHLFALDRHRSPRRTAHSANEGSDPSRVERRERIARNPSKAMVRSATASYGKYRSTAHSLVEISPYDLDPFKISYTVFTVPSSQQLAGQHQVKVSLSKTATRQIVIIIVIAATRLARAATTEGKLHRLPAFTSVALGSGGDHASRTLSCPRSLLFRSVRVALSAQRLPTKIRKLVDVARRDLILMRRHGLA